MVAKIIAKKLLFIHKPTDYRLHNQTKRQTNTPMSMTARLVSALPLRLTPTA